MNKSIQVYGIKNCDTVKKALVYLNDHDVNYQFIDFRQNPISQQVLTKMVESVGWELLINKRSTTYRSLSEEEKNNINYDLVLRLPTLIKRPVLVRDENIMVGFSEQQYAKLL
jgi:arsenate reductase